VPAQIELGQRCRQVERRVASRLWNVLEQILNFTHPDGFEHVAAFRVGVR
jgi:hypothetical protein